MQVEQAEKKRKREEEKAAKAVAREAAKLQKAAEKAEKKRLADELRAAKARTAQENADKLAAINAGLQGALTRFKPALMACIWLMARM